MSDTHADKFLAILVYDVMAAMNRRQKMDNQSARRDLIRSTFAAIEGIIWSFREKVKNAAEETFGLSDQESHALEEVQYYVNEQGKVTEQSRYISATATFRLAVRIAHRINDKLDVDFSDHEWETFRLALAVRNRITHPKAASDLHVSDDDLERAQAALLWLLEAQDRVLSSTIKTRERYVKLFRDVLEKLEAGDPETTALYQALLAASEE